MASHRRHAMQWWAIVCLPAIAAPVVADVEQRELEYELIIRFEAPPSDEQLAAVAAEFQGIVSWRALRHAPHPKNDPTGVHPLASVRVATLCGVDECDVPELATAITVKRPAGVKYAEPNGIMRPAGEFIPNDPLYPEQWAPQMIDAPEAWAITTGNSSVVVAVIDTGLEFDHEEFPDDALWNNPGEIPGNGIDDDGNGFVDDVVGWDFIDNDNWPEDISQFGHGTFVTGLLGARLDNATGIAGLANVRILTAKFRLSVDQAVSAMYYAVDADVDVINFSHIGGDSPELAGAVQYAWDNNVTFVAGAGNIGRDCMGWPAAYPTVIAVGATNDLDELWDRSSYGAWIDVTAPGESILSTTIAERDWYRTSNGTSAASPYVAGLVALMHSVDTSLTVAKVRGFLQTTAVDLGEPGFDTRFGHGRISAAQAVAGVKHAMECPADVNADNRVDTADLLDVLVAWGTDDWRADINGDGDVDFADLIHVLTAWGACS